MSKTDPVVVRRLIQKRLQNQAHRLYLWVQVGWRHGRIIPYQNSSSKQSQNKESSEGHRLNDHRRLP